MKGMLRRALLTASALLLAACGSDASTTQSTASGSGGASGGAGGTAQGGAGGTATGTGGMSTGGAGGATTSGTGGMSSGGTGGMSTGGSAPMACPADMAHVGVFCMDRYEAPNQPGADPLVMQSAVAAESWCEAAGKRLCTEDEWVSACEGSQKHTYPYGDTHVASRCNDDKTWKVVNESVLNTWPSAAAKAEVEKLWQGAPSGSYTECVSEDGVYDLTGNVEEWVVRTQPHTNNYPHVLKGCYWAGCYGGSKPTCASTNPAHADGFMYYETGFRCCLDAMIIP
ncbi:Flagellar hook-length control protein FliK [Minicystis rosea]|nr:Flagellar hook-length control protein FliK [Minicystis rosea]